MNLTENAQIRPNPSSHAMKWGMVIGACFAANFLLSASGIAALSVLTYLLEAVILVLSWRVTRSYRDTECGGVMSFGQVWWYITLLFFFASLIGAIVKWGYMKWINTGYLDDLFSQTMLLLEQMKVELPEAAVEQVEAMMTPTQFAMQSIFSDTLLGALLGLIYAPFLKSKKPLENGETNIDSDSSAQ